MQTDFIISPSIRPLLLVHARIPLGYSAPHDVPIPPAMARSLERQAQSVHPHEVSSTRRVPKKRRLTWPTLWRRAVKAIGVDQTASKTSRRNDRGWYSMRTGTIEPAVSSIHTVKVVRPLVRLLRILP